MINPWFLFLAIWHLFVLFVLRILLRKQWVAVLVYVMFFSILVSMTGPAWTSMTSRFINLFCHATWFILLALTLFRFGLLSLIVAMLFHMRLQQLPITLDFSSWYASGSMIIILFLSAIVVYGFHTALAGRSLFKDELLEN